MNTNVYKSYNPANCVAKMGRNTPAKVTICKSGLISFNRKATEALSLKTGDKIEFIQDLTNKKDWFVRKDTNGFELSLNKSFTSPFNIKFNCITLVEEIFRSLDIHNTVSILISTSPDEMGMFAIITSSIKGV